MKVIWFFAIIVFSVLCYKVALSAEILGLKAKKSHTLTREYKRSTYMQYAAHLENVSFKESPVMFSKISHPGFWYKAQEKTLLRPGERVFVPQNATADVVYNPSFLKKADLAQRKLLSGKHLDGKNEEKIDEKGGDYRDNNLENSASVTLPEGAVYIVDTKLRLDSLHRQVFYFESEQQTVNSPKESAEPSPQFARAFWMRPGKAPPKVSKEGGELFSTQVDAREIEIVKPEADMVVDSPEFPFRQEVILGLARNDNTPLVAYLFDEESGFSPVWSMALGRSRAFEITIPKPGNYSFVALSEDQMSSTRHLKLYIRQLEEAE